MKRASHAKVRIIPPIPKEHKKLKVAAYCRVSTFRSAQQCSLEVQIKIYTKMIQSHPGWIFVGVFIVLKVDCVEAAEPGWAIC